VSTISRFRGITISMYVPDHPPPHFHVRCGDESVRVRLDTLSSMDGRLSPRARRLVRQWARMHRHDLDENWRRIEQRQRPKAIRPLR
jgi:hypothetical protein